MRLPLAVLLLTPLIVHWIGFFFVPTFLVYVLTSIGVAAAVVMWKRPARSEWESLGVWAFFFTVAFALVHRWTDFFPIGERIRDYAVLASVVRDPIFPIEPWMPWEPLNYYVFWHRVAAEIATLFSIPLWSLYHAMCAFAISLYATLVWVVCRRIGGLSRLWAFLGSVAIAFGSNLQGVITVFSGSTSWWGASRVIPNTINEFPAWSFLLSDMHPHFLNLGMLPLWVLVGHWIVTEEDSYFGNHLLFWPLAGLWLYVANSWELPVWVAGVAVIFILGRGWHHLRRPRWDRRGIFLIAVYLLLISSLWHMVRQIQGVGISLRFLGWTDYKSGFSELMRHWGIWVGMGFASMGLLVRTRRWRRAPLIEAFGILAFGIVIGCEFFYFDDAYTGELERINTVFKLYIPAWTFMALWAWTLMSDALRPWRRAYWIPIGVLVILVAFFVRMVPIRMSEGDSRGLATATHRMGSTFVPLMAMLDSLPPSRVMLEAPGDAYSYANIVSSISGHMAYLGWENHVNLLTQNYGEVNRRHRVIERFYHPRTSCEERRHMLVDEHIDMALWGVLENERFGPASDNALSCLKMWFNENGTQVVSAMERPAFRTP